MKNLLIFSLFSLFSLAVYTQSGELKIYPYDYYNNGLLSLTDNYPFSKYEDSIYVIERRYLGSAILDSNGYHVLNEVKRSLFLRRMNISKNDSLFIYHYPSDSLASFAIHDLKIAACLEPYVHGFPILPYHYMVGLELGSKIKFHSESFAYIGSENIFIRNGLQPMVWEQVDNLNFPFVGYPKGLERFKDHNRGTTFQFEAKGFIFYLQNLKWTSRLDARHLVVKNVEDETVVLNKVYHVSESNELREITIKNEEQHNFKSMQWMGNLLEGKPLVMFGFLSHSFDCPTIDFISDKEESIIMKCDNRH